MISVAGKVQTSIWRAGLAKLVQQLSYEYNTIEWSQEHSPEGTRRHEGGVTISRLPGISALSCG